MDKERKRERSARLKSAYNQFRFCSGPLCKWIMVLRWLAEFLDGEYVATAEGQFINCQTPGPGSMRELRFDGGRKGNGERGRVRERRWARAAWL